MGSPGYIPYEPQLELRPIADDIWIVDGPEVDYRFAGMKLPCPTRMTIVRAAGGKLWFHSPTAYTDALAAQLAVLGEVGWIIAPNSFHYTHMATWARAYPAARCHAVPDVIDKIGTAVPSVEPLGTSPPTDWADALDQILVELGSFTEAVFFHRQSRSLIVTDLVQNFEADRIPGRFTRLILNMGGATGPRGTTSMDIRLAARGQHAAVRAAAVQMAAWAPARIILSHGKCYESDIEAELKGAFSWATG